jgi:hypothetical protein
MRIALVICGAHGHWCVCGRCVAAEAIVQLRYAAAHVEKNAAHVAPGGVAADAIAPPLRSDSPPAQLSNAVRQLPAVGAVADAVSADSSAGQHAPTCGGLNTLPPAESQNSRAGSAMASGCGPYGRSTTGMSTPALVRRMMRPVSDGDAPLADRVRLAVGSTDCDSGAVRVRVRSRETLRGSLPVALAGCDPVVDGDALQRAEADAVLCTLGERVAVALRLRVGVGGSDAVRLAVAVRVGGGVTVAENVDWREAVGVRV